MASHFIRARNAVTNLSMARLAHGHLLAIVKGSAKTINQFRLGVQVATVSGLTIDQLHENACRDRFQLAQQTLRSARWALAGSYYRVALGRAYYATYHAARAVVFYTTGGDDYEAHSDLPQHMPKDFPDREKWENDIKNSRFERNRADYDPYPKADRAFAQVARSTLATADAFLPVARRYLARKGCPI